MDQTTNTGILSNLADISHIYHPSEILINLVLSFILGVLISLIYKKTHKGLSYSQSFMVTNIFVAVIVCMVIMIIGNSLARAFALVGALSIIRFRTVVKDTKDTAYIFWSLASGMAAGTGSYFLAIAGSIIISGIALILFYTNFGSIIKSEFIVQFRINSNDSNITSQYNKLISDFTKSQTLLSSESSGDGQTIKVSFDVVMKEEMKQNELISKISKIDGVSEVVIIAAKSDVDY
jgi:uncharacterized membrane protein YhiD involved in acid resistance